MIGSRFQLPMATALTLALCAPLIPAQETILHNFGSRSGTDGTQPAAGLTFDSKGNLFGTTTFGGTYAGEATGGTVFELSPQAEGTWKYQVIFSFGASDTDASWPIAGVIFDSKGNLYGTTESGGANGFGTVFELSSNGDGTWSEQILYSFGASDSDGTVPKAGLALDSLGNLYGTTYDGGQYNGGTVFELSPGANGWTEAILHNFSTSTTDGYQVLSGLIFDSKGNLYGTTYGGGAAGNGTVYQLAPQSNGTWTFTLLHSFSGAEDGANPWSGVIFDSNGNLYGTAGILADSMEGGVVYKLSPQSDGTWNEAILYTFQAYNASDDGYGPQAGLVFDPSGNLYGTTVCGGTNDLGLGCGAGTIFELSPAANSAWKERILYDFGATSTDASGPTNGSLVLDASGNFYGTTVGGGANSTGAVFKFTPAMPAAALPQFSPKAGTYASAQSVQITDSTPGAAIYYTTDASTPTTSSTKYDGAIDVTRSGTIEAIAVASGYSQSSVASASYVIGLPPAAAPIIKPDGGTFSAPVAVTISDSTPNATIYYTANGSAPTTSSSVYKSAIQVAASETIKAIAVASGYTTSNSSSATFIIEPAAVSTPSIAPSGGTYGASILVKITDTTSGAQIYFTTNGSTPTVASAKYTAEVRIAKDTTLKAIASVSGRGLSSVASAVYRIRTATPVVTPKPGKYSKTQLVRITDGTRGATIYYTTNGATPGVSSKKYTGEFAVTEDETVKAVAFAPGLTESEIASDSISIQTATPAIAPDGGSFAAARTVTITDATKGAVIYYTTNGVAPNTKSIRYTRTFRVSGRETVKAVAIAPGHAPSEIASAKFTIP